MLNDKIIKKNFAFSALPASSSALNQCEISFPQESEQKYSAFLPSVHKPEQGMPKISRALNDEVVFHISVPHSRNQNVVVAWTAVAAKKYVGEPSCPVLDKSLGIKKSKREQKSGMAGKHKNMFPLPACPSVQPSLRCEERQKAFLPFRESPQVAMEQRTGKSPHTVQKKSSLSLRQRRTALFISPAVKRFKKLFSRALSCFFAKGKRRACPRFKTAATRLLNARIREIWKGEACRPHSVLPKRGNSNNT